jgi:hypothetical protein
MSNRPKRPFNPVFFVARSHRDLSFHLSVNTHKRAANDQDMNRRERARDEESARHEKSNVLYFVPRS